ncbi:NAD(P)/FAD-dependent oxidoreductase [Imbroritus primus]|uniref:NAD(P)/FAD-dependent oxidoreductase n=1 Tax=Imbroritus primus TaxID=3058603 RepID=UPI003D160D0B
MSTPLRIVIIGGGVIGSAIATFLTQTPGACEVTVLERDPTYGNASSARSASSIRQQFSTPVNIRMSQYGIDFFRHIGTQLRVGETAPDIGLVEPGYLFLASTAGAASLQENVRMQHAHGVAVDLLSSTQLRMAFPWLATRGLRCGALGRAGEGWYDGYSVLQAFRTKARAQGVAFVHAEASGFVRRGSRVAGVTVREGAALHCDMAVNAAGPWAAVVARWAGIELPVHARRRTVFSFTCPERLPRCPLVIDPGGLWFRPEGEQFLCGYAPAPADDLDDLPLDPDIGAFESLVWPALAQRVPAFAAVRLTGAWAGYYEMNVFDHNAILGLHADCPNLYFANGFSGHGLQHAPAVGRGLAELMLLGGYRSLDLSPLAFSRISERRPLMERNII